MSFVPGAMVGKVGLDMSPVAVAVNEGIGHAKRMKAGVEGDLGNLKAKIDLGGWQASVQTMRAGFSAAVNGIEQDVLRITSAVAKAAEQIRSIPKAEFFGEGGPTSYTPPAPAPTITTPVTTNLNAAADRSLNLLSKSPALNDVFTGVVQKSKQAAGEIEWNFSRINLKPRVQIDAASLNTSQATPAILQTNAVASKAEAAGKAAGESWLLGLVKRIRQDDRASGELVLQMFASRGLAGVADIGLSAAGLGVAAIGIQFTASVANDLLLKSREVTKEWQAGNINAADMSMSLGKSLPVLGKVFELGENISDSFTGNKSAIEENNREIERMAKATEAVKNYADAARTMFADMARLSSEVKFEGAATNAKLEGNQAAAEQIAADAELARKIKSAEETVKTDVSKIRSTNAEKVATLGAFSLNELQQLREEKAISDEKDKKYGGFGVSRGDEMSAANIDRLLKLELINKQREVANKQAEADIKAAEKELKKNIAGMKENAAQAAKLRNVQSPEKLALNDLRSQAQTMGMDDTEKKIFALERTPGSDPAVIEQLKQEAGRIKDFKLGVEGEIFNANEAKTIREINLGIQSVGEELTRLDAHDEWEKQTAAAERFAEQLKNLQSPAEKFAAGMSQIKAGLTQKLIDPDEAEKLIGGLKKDVYGGLLDSIKSPAEKLQEQLSTIEDALAVGAISGDQYDRAVAKARKDSFGEDQAPRLIRSGSAAAQMATVAGNLPKEASQLDTLKKSLKTQENIERGITKLADSKVAIIADDGGSFA